jgi:methyl-accepting chemotaxis protein
MKARKVLLINPRFQLTFIAFAVGIAVVETGIFYAATRAFFSRCRSEAQAAGLSQNHIFYQLLSDQELLFGAILVGACVVASLTVILVCLYLSHRVAGPIHRMRQHIAAVAEGKTENDVHFRKRDFFPELAVSFNLLMKKLREKKL